MESESEKEQEMEQEKEQESLIRTGKTVEEAIELALLELDVGRADVEVSIVSKGRAGILGIGAEPVRVRVTRISEGAGGLAVAMEVVADILKRMDVEALPTIRSSGAGPDAPPVIDIQGVDAGLLIGRRGETLQALQFVVNLLLRHRLEPAQRSLVAVDVEQYRERREQHLSGLAHRLATQVAASGKSMVMEPMSAADRRIVHMALADHNRVTTVSTGEGRDRKLTIRPMEGGQREAPQ